MRNYYFDGRITFAVKKTKETNFETKTNRNSFSYASDKIPKNYDP